MYKYIHSGTSRTNLKGVKKRNELTDMKKKIIFKNYFNSLQFFQQSGVFKTNSIIGFLNSRSIHGLHNDFVCSGHFVSGDGG